MLLTVFHYNTAPGFLDVRTSRLVSILKGVKLATIINNYSNNHACTSMNVYWYKIIVWSRYGDNYIDIVVSLISATKNIYTVRANLWLCTSTCSTSDCCSFKQPVMCIHAYIHVIPLYRCTCLQYFHITYI